jgi:hypothetical protein
VQEPLFKWNVLNNLVFIQKSLGWAIDILSEVQDRPHPFKKRRVVPAGDARPPTATEWSLDHYWTWFHDPFGCPPPLDAGEVSHILYIYTIVRQNATRRLGSREAWPKYFASTKSAEPKHIIPRPWLYQHISMPQNRHRTFAGSGIHWSSFSTLMLSKLNRLLRNRSLNNRKAEHGYSTWLWNCSLLYRRGSTRGKRDYPSRANSMRTQRHLAGLKRFRVEDRHYYINSRDVFSYDQAVHEQSVVLFKHLPESLNRILVAGLVLLVYDQIITWDKELNRIWRFVSFVKAIVEDLLWCFQRAVVAIGVWK